MSHNNNDGNYSISKVRFWSIIGFLLMGGFIYLQIVYYLIPEFIELKNNEFLDLYDLKYIWLVINAYLMFTLEIVLATMMISGKKIKLRIGNPLNLNRVSVGLLDALVIGFMAGLVLCFVVGLVCSFISGFVFGFVVGFVVGLLFCLAIGLEAGLKAEFKKDST